MVKQKSQLFFSPSVYAAITISILIYSGLLPLSNRNEFNSIVPKNTIQYLEGYIVSNPSKTESGNFYSMTVEPSLVSSENIASHSSGYVQLLMPTDIVEALYPGKLFTNTYSSMQHSFPLIEQGLHFFSNVGYVNTNDNGMPLYISYSIDSLGWKNSLSKMRATLRIQFKRLLYAWGDSGGLLLALLSGAREYTNPQLANAFQGAGLSHILALSGMHLSVFTALALNGGKILAGKKVGTVLSLIAVLLFVWFAGISPSLLRALICTILAVLLDLCALPGVSGNAEIVFRFISPSFSCIRLIRMLSLAFLIHVCLYPMDVFKAAFMLSYGALIGIALAEYLIKPWIVRYLPIQISSPLAAAIGAQLCTAPVTISLFGTIMPIGIIASVVVSPLALGYVVLGIFSIIISIAIPFLLYPIGDIMSVVYGILEYIVLFFSKFPPIIF